MQPYKCKIIMKPDATSRNTAYFITLHIGYVNSVGNVFKVIFNYFF